MIKEILNNIMNNPKTKREIEKFEFMEELLQN